MNYISKVLVKRCMQRGLIKLNLNFVRNLTATQTATALRPFYFTVHPDLFGQFPKAREANEQSLKILNEYINGLRSKEKVRPVSLLFYIRTTNVNEKQQSEYSNEEPDTFRTVRVSLLSDNIWTTISTILRSCNLPLDYINSVKTSSSTIPEFGRPIKWDHTYYTFYGIPNPDEPKKKPVKVVQTLSSWLSTNISKARKRQSAYESIRAETVKLKKELIKESGLISVKWLSGWGFTQYRASLNGFLRVYRKHKDQIDLKGHSLVFAHENGICLRGNVIVKHDDLADTWVPMLKSISKYTAILMKLPAHENLLSHLLNNVNVVRRTGSPVILAGEYLEQLKRLSKSLEAYFLESDNHLLSVGSMRDVDLVVDCAQGPLHITPAGQILVPSFCPAFLIVDFLNDNADTARQMKVEFQRKDKIVLQLVKKCKEVLELQSLCKDTNITWEQMETFCEKLLKESGSLGSSLNGCRVKVALFYSVMSDGEMYIPWNWKGIDDES